MLLPLGIKNVNCFMTDDGEVHKTPYDAISHEFRNWVRKNNLHQPHGIYQVLENPELAQDLNAFILMLQEAEAEEEEE